MKKVLAIVLTLCMLVSVIPMSLSVSAENTVSNLVFDCGDMENDLPGILDNSTGGKATSTKSDEAKKNGNFSNKMYFPDDANGNIVLWVESNTNYDLLPLDEYVYVTFWAKADDVTGFRGAVLVNDTAQYDSEKGNKERIDGWSGQFGIGSGLSSDGWSEVSKVWTKYYVPVSGKTLKDTETVDYEILVSQIYFTGKGTIYIDDINVEAQEPSLIDYGNFEAGDPFIGLGGDASLGRTSEEKRNGRYSAKYVGTESNYKEVFLVSQTDYNDIPRGKNIKLTFWAKAGEEGFTGAFGTANFAQGNYGSWWGDRYKLDGNMWLYAFGGANGTETNSANYETLSKEWTKYSMYIPTSLIESENYNAVFAQIKIMGTGTFYIDDIDIEVQELPLIDNGGFELGDAIEVIPWESDVTPIRTYEESKTGRYSTKFVGTNNQKTDFIIKSTTKFADIPVGEKIALTFWAKADETTGFTGTFGTGNFAQGNVGAWWGDRYKLDGDMMLYAFGGVNGTAINSANYETLPTEWTKYYLSLPKTLIESDNYSAVFAEIKIFGTGTLYIDDFNIELFNDILDNGTVDNGGAENAAYSCAYPENVTITHDSNIKYNGRYSTKIAGNDNALAKLDMRIDSTGEHYAKIPLNEQIYITFWAKADDAVGFSGFIGSGNIYQLPSVEESGKRDGWAMTTAFGSSDMSEAGFVEISKEWTKYFIKVNDFFTDGFESAYAYIKINGYGTLYIDDIAFETVDESLLDNTGYGANISLGAINLSVKSHNYGNTVTSDLFAQNSFSQSIKVSNTIADEAIGNLHAVVKNAAGKIVYSETFAINVAAREYDVFTITVPVLTEYGKYTVNYIYTNANGTYTAQTEFSNVKKSENNSGIYNICLNLGSETDAKYDSVFEALSNSGAEYFRIDIRWENVETAIGTYNFPEYYARMFASAQKYGMKPLVIVAYKNALYGNVDSNSFFSDTDAVTAYAAFAAKIVETYADYVDAIEIYNEPNYLNVPAADYANMLKASYTSIKAVKDTVKVIGGVTSKVDDDYISDIIDNGAGDYMDVVSVHPYVYNNLLGSNPEKIVAEIAKVSTVLSQKNCNKPIWATELNWPTNDSLYGCTEIEQAEYLTRAMILLQGEKSVEKVFVYTATDNDTGNTDTEKVFGIFKSANYTTANAAKLSYVALSQFANATYGMNADGAVNLENNVKAYSYSNGKNSITAIWSTGRATTVNWTVNDSVKIYDIYGNLMYVSANNGVTQITVDSAPVYVVNYINGDVTEDNVVNVIDLVRIKKNFSNNICLEAMDVTKDYTVDSSDMVELRKQLLNK